MSKDTPLTYDEDIPENSPDFAEDLRTYFHRMELDPQATKRTLGAAFDRSSPDAILESTKKLIKVSRREVDTDDRDSLEFQKVYDVTDFLPEKVRNDQGNLMKSLLWKITNTGQLDKIPTAALDKHVKHLFNSSGLSQNLEQINVFDHLDQNMKVTRMGEGGIPSIDSVPKEARNVQSTQLSFLDPVLTPERMRIGVDLAFARGVKKGKDGQIYKEFRNAQTGKLQYISAKDAANSIIAFPGGLNNKDKFVPAMSQGKGIFLVPREEVQYELPDGDDMFNDITNTVPLKSGVKGMRLFMGAKFIKAAVPLVNREAAYVQPADKDGTSFYDKLSKYAGVVRSDKDAVVKKVGKDSIVLEYADGTTETKELYNQHPYARKTFIHNTPVVKPGQVVKANDLLATSNYADSKGTVAAGLNLRMAYSAARGNTFEDSMVISQSAAKKLTSEHLYHEDIDEDDSIALSKTRFTQLFPGKYTKEQLQVLDDNGVVKPGTVLKPGDPIYLGVKQIQPGPGNMGRGAVRMEVRTWDHDHPGIVTDIGKTKTGYSTYIRTNSPAQVGDKMSNLYGSKGVISEIVPDEEMMRDSEGRPVDVLMSPLGIYSRTNSAQIVAATLGKIAAKTGKPYIVPGFTDENMIEMAEKELQKNNMTDREDVYDPVSGKTIPKVFVGNLYFYKLQHMAESKAKARGEGDAYTADDEPSKGAGANSKHFGDMEWHALLSHNAPSVIKDIKMIKGRRNDAFWRAVKLGQTPALPGNPPIYDKFKAYIKAAGVNLVEDKNKTYMFAMTNNDAKKLTGTNKLESAETYGANSFKPIPGGLFDPDKTGSLADGKSWAYYETPEPFVNPVMEEPIRSLLGVTKKDFDLIVSGEKPLEGKYGGAAIKEYLSNLDIDKTIDRAKETLKSGAKSKKDAALKLLGYAAAMKKNNVSPADFMMDRIPVLPPAFRPITSGGKLTMVADPNYLYKELFSSIQDLKEAKTLPPELQTQARKAVYDNYRALVGTTDPTQEKMVQKNVGGILDQLLGKSSPKFSMYQRRVIGANVDLSGLSVATLNPSLKLNQIGLPEEEAWKVYEPFVIRKLVQSNYPAAYAAKAVQEKNPVAYQALQKAVSERPVLMNRAPTLHKYSIMSFWPVLTKGHTVQVPPAIHSQYGLDHDGDTISYSVPVSKEAVQEAIEKMMPEKNLISVRNDKPNYTPSQDYLMGLHYASKEPANEKVQRFATKEDAMQAYRKGLIRVDTPIKIG